MEMLIPRIIMLMTLILMLSGKAPIYLTAIVGATVAALSAGFPLRGADVNIVGLLSAGLHGVIIDMLGVLLFIGVMEKAGFLNAIIIRIMHFGRKVGGGPGVCTVGGIAAGVIGGMSGFTQPAITAVITGPPAIELGVDKNKVAGTIAHAGTLGNFGGFTHPTLVAVMATAGITFGLINVIGAVVGLSIFAASYFRLTREMKKNKVLASGNAKEFVMETTNIPFLKAILPFIILIVGFIAGIPIVMVGIFSSILVILMTDRNFITGEKAMMEGLTRITVPLLATVAFLYMSAVIHAIGMVAIVSNLLEPYLAVAPIFMMLLVSSVAGLITQSNAASAAIVVPFLAVVLASGANPFAAAIAAAGGPAIMQYYLTGGPIAALSTVIPVIPGSDLKTANRFQRPSILVGLLVLFIITIFL
ncbi:MAG: hypothetical protein FWC64_02425 [Treponema sp.]|nr:hypothetical protein [Treponema sp.]